MMLSLRRPGGLSQLRLTERCTWPLHRMRHRCSDKGATLVLVKDKGGAIFGGFAATPWQRHGDFFGQHASI